MILTNITNQEQLQNSINTGNPVLIYFSGENCSFVQGSDKIIIKNGRLEHKQFQLRGALPPMEAPTVYITGFTPFSHHLFLS